MGTENTPNAERLARAQAGDGLAFEELVADQQRFLFALAKGRLGDEHAAYDAVQETLLQAWRHLHTLRTEVALRSWLATIAVRVCERLRQQRLAQRSMSLAVALNRPTMQTDAAEIERRAALADSIRQLDDEAQQILALRHAEELSYAEIAQRLSISEDAVRGRLFHAREAIRKRLGIRKL